MLDKVRAGRCRPLFTMQVPSYDSCEQICIQLRKIFSMTYAYQRDTFHQCVSVDYAYMYCGRSENFHSLNGSVAKPVLHDENNFK